MRDSIIKNTGNSRYLKSAISAATTWEQFRAALIAGTLPIDLNGINTAGWQQVGDALNKANLLSDATVAALNAFLTSTLPVNPKVNDALNGLANTSIGKFATGSYVGTGTDSLVLSIPAWAKFVVLLDDSGAKSTCPWIFMVRGMAGVDYKYLSGSSNIMYTNITWADTSVTLAYTGGAMNISGKNYRYVVIG